MGAARRRRAQTGPWSLRGILIKGRVGAFQGMEGGVEKASSQFCEGRGHAPPVYHRTPESSTVLALGDAQQKVVE